MRERLCVILTPFLHLLLHDRLRIQIVLLFHGIQTKDAIKLRMRFAKSINSVLPKHNDGELL